MKAVVPTSFFGVGLLFLCSGCALQGKVTDVETGEPIAGAEVGRIVSYPFLADSSHYVAETETGADGRFELAGFRFFPLISVRTPGYQYGAANLFSPGASLDFELRSIQAIKGTWNMTITPEVGAAIDRTVEIREDGLAWFLNEREYGVVPFAFDGTTIEVDGYFLAGTYTLGMMEATLALDESGDSLHGQITVLDERFVEGGCESCGGSVEASRVGS